MGEERKFNVNELLERKKELESEISENTIEPEELKHREEKIIDFVSAKNSRTVETRPKITLEEYSQRYYGLLTELEKVKTAIQKYNAENVLGKLYKRDELRRKIEYLTKIKSVLIENKQYGRQITRQNKEGETLEATEIEIEPMFEKKLVQNQIDQLSAEQRKINTEIQKLNLQAEIPL